MRCAIYTRVSTDIQVEEGYSLESQKQRLEAYATAQGWEIHDFYVDEGYSAKNIDRPQLQRMLADMKLKVFDVILVLKLDRLVRNVMNLHELLHDMDKYGVMFRSATESFDTTSASGRLFISLVGTLAQWERETIAERVYSTMKTRAENGLLNGGPAPYGYDWEEGHLVVNEDEANVVRKIFEMYRSSGTAAIAKNLNSQGYRTKKGALWSDFSVMYILNNSTYCGKIQWNKRRPKKNNRDGHVESDIEQDDFESIISEEVFEEAQKMLKHRQTHGAFKSIEHYHFSTLLICPKCKHSLIGARKVRRSGSVYRYYKCRGRFQKGICDLPAIPEESFDNAFIDVLELQNVMQESDIQQEEKQDKTKIKNRINKIAEQKSRLKDMYKWGDIDRDEYREDMELLIEEEKELHELLNTSVEVVSNEEQIQALYELKKYWHQIDYETKQKALHSLFESFTFEVVEPTRTGKYPVPAIIKFTGYRFK